MSAREPGSRHPRRGSLGVGDGRPESTRIRAGLFGAVIVSVLLIGGYLAFGDLVFGQRAATSGGAVSVQASMAGFTPSVIHVKAGQAVTLDWWTTDAPMHLTNGVHTMVSPELGLNEQLRGASTSGESRTLVHFTAPMTPGTYDIVCESCCGGGANPAMHGKIVVDA